MFDKNNGSVDISQHADSISRVTGRSMSKAPKQSDKRVFRRQSQTANAVLALTGGKSILHWLPIAVVVFDGDLKIVDSNSRMSDLIYPEEYIDKSLAKGTDENVCLDWTEQIKNVLSSGTKRIFYEVGYTLNDTMRLLRISCTPLPNDDAKKVGGGTIVIEDVTAARDMQRELAEAEKLAALGRLAAKVAHELNNPMDGILRYMNLAIRAVEQEKLEKPKEYLSQCRDGLMRMVQITSELLEFSRRTRTSLEYVKIEQLIEDAIKTIVPRSEGLDIRILRDYGGNIPEILSGNLFQVFCNLAKNSLDAMPDGGELRVSARLGGEDTIVVEFQDTGTGFAAEDAEALFKPFFTTRDSGKGTGLGLAICRDIVEKRHGRITAKNSPDGGCVFTVLLPVKGKSIRKG